MTKQDALERLQRAHDMVKEHPYRYNFSEEFMEDYADRLLELSDAWCTLIYRADIADGEQRLMKKFGEWIHNYNASIIGRRIRRDLIPFYDGVLSVTHRYLDAGEINGYYALEYRYDDNNYYGARKEIPIWFYLVTKESCGIDSPDLPLFFPKTERLSDSKEALRKYLDKYFWNKSTEYRDKFADDWEANLLPVIQWHNKNLNSNAPESPIYNAI